MSKRQNRSSTRNSKAKRSFSKEENTISIPIAVFSAVSVTIGAGMVSVPRTSFESGIPFGIAYNLLNYVLTIYSIHLLLESARMTGLYSMPRLAYDCFGHYSLYFVNFVQFIAFGILPLAYFIIFAGILSSFMNEIPGLPESGWRFLGTQWFSVLLLGAIIFPLIIKKRIGELSIAGALLFFGVLLFNILLIVVKLDPHVETSYTPNDNSRLFGFRFNQAFLSSLSTAFVAYGFQSGFFPIYNSLETQTYRNGMKFSIYAMGFSFCIYVCIMFTGLLNFGSAIEGDVLTNISKLTCWESYVIRGIFLLIMVTHTPFTFFIGKESVLCLAVLIYYAFKTPKKSENGYNQILAEDEGEQAQERGQKPDLNITPATEQSVQRTSRSMEQDEFLQDVLLKKVNAENTMSLAIPHTRSTVHVHELAPGRSEVDFENAAAHELLPDSIYYPVTIGLFVMVVGSACVIRDVESVIKYIGSLGNSILNFLIPGICYFIISRKYEKETTSALQQYSALGLAIYGGVLAIICTGVNIWTTISPLEE